MKNAIVIGANGFIGSELVKELNNNGYFVYALTHKNEYSVNNNVKNIECPMNDVENVVGLPSTVDYLFDASWIGTSGVSRGDLDLQLKNVKWRSKVIRLCKRLNCRYIGFGSMMELESIQSTFFDESRPQIESIYSHSKYMAHAVSKAMAVDLDVDYVWGKITNSYGPGEHSARLINMVIRKVITNEVPIFSSGSQYYDFIYISDLVKAFRLMAEKGKSFTDYTLSSGSPKKLRAYLEEMNNLIAPDMNFIFKESSDCSKNIDVSSYSANKIITDTGFTSSVSFSEGIMKTYTWIQNNFN